MATIQEMKIRSIKSNTQDYRSENKNHISSTTGRKQDTENSKSDSKKWQIWENASKTRERNTKAIESTRSKLNEHKLHENNNKKPDLRNNQSPLHTKLHELTENFKKQKEKKIQIEAKVLINSHTNIRDRQEISEVSERSSLT